MQSMQLQQKILYRLHLRSIGEFLYIALQLVRFKERGHQLVVVSEGAVARTLFREILGPGFLFAFRRKTANLHSACERIALSAAGLGEKKIVFHKSENSTHAHEKITEAFPALTSAGGYEILRIADDKSESV